MAKFVKREKFAIEKDPNADQSKYSFDAIFRQVCGTSKRVSERMDQIKRAEERSWENSKLRNSGL